MRKLGMDTLIIQATAVEAGAMYPSRTLPRREGWGTSDPVGVLMDLAEAHNIRVFLGLHGYNLYAKGAALSKAIELNRQVARELIERYGSRPNLAGWYLPAEAGNGLGATGGLVTLYRTLADELHAASPGKAVASAPVSPCSRPERWSCREAPRPAALPVGAIRSPCGRRTMRIKDRLGRTARQPTQVR